MIKTIGALLMISTALVVILLLGVTGQLFETIVAMTFNLVMGGLFLIGFLLFKGEVG